MKTSVLRATRRGLGAGVLSAIALIHSARADVVRHLLLFGGSYPGWLPLAAGQPPQDYESFTTGQYYAGGAIRSGFSGFLSAAGYAFSRPSTATYVNGAGAIASASGGVARFSYNPTTLAAKGLFLEGASTNLIYPSIPYTTLNWANLNLTVAANAATAPDGTTTATELADTATNVVHQLKNSNVGTLSSGTQYSSSVFFQNVNRRYAFLTTGNGGTSNGFYAFADLVAGSITNSGEFGSSMLLSSGVTSYPSGWWLLTTTGSFSSSSSGNVQDSLSNNGTASTYAGNGSSLYTWGAQLEAVAFPTSYIPTTTGTASRSADSLSRSLLASPSALTLAFGAQTPAGVGTEQTLWSINNGTSSNQIRVVYQSDGHLHVIVTAGGTAEANLDLGSVAVNTSFGLSLRAAAGNFAASLDGGAVVSQTSGSMPSGLLTEQIGSGVSAGNEWFSTIRWRGEWNFADANNHDLQALSVNR